MKINATSVRTSDTSSIERSFGAKLVEQTSKFSTSTDQMAKEQKPAMSTDAGIKANTVAADVKPVVADTSTTLTAIYSDSASVRGDTKDAGVKAPDVKTDPSTGGVKPAAVSTTVVSTGTTDGQTKAGGDIDYLSQIKRA
jgi:hypothetical protein